MKIEKLSLKPSMYDTHNIKVLLNVLIDAHNALGEEVKPSWEERFEEEFGTWFYSPDYQGYVKLRNVTKDFIRKLLNEGK